MGKSSQSEKIFSHPQFFARVDSHSVLLVPRNRRARVPILPLLPQERRSGNKICGAPVVCRSKASPQTGKIGTQHFVMLIRGTLIILLLFGRVLFAADATDTKLPNIVILATGGTIAGSGKSSTTTVGYQAATVAVEQLIQAVPELKKISNPRGEQVLQLASQNITNDDWLKLAKRINELEQQSDVDGIVITHGTDTLEETAYFLDLTTKGPKPVVIVGSMRPSTALSADGPLNLYDAVLLASSKDSVGKGVLVCLEDQISSARDVTKTNTFTTDTFKSPDLGFLGYIQGDRVAFYRSPSRKHTTETEFDIANLDKLPIVEIAYGYENVSRTVVDALAAAKVDGIIYAGVGDGNPNKINEEALADARAKGILVVRSARVGNGIIARNNEVDDDKRDFVASDNLNPQKARILLTLALTKTKDTKEIQRMFFTY
jgi:L-asparaginase